VLFDNAVVRGYDVVLAILLSFGLACGVTSVMCAGFAGMVVVAVGDDGDGDVVWVGLGGRVSRVGA